MGIARQRRRQLGAAVVILCLAWQLMISSVAVAASIIVNPTSGPPGTEAELSGSGFVLFIDVALCWNRSGCSDLGIAHVNSQGRFGAGITIPEAAPGSYQIFACQLLSTGLTCTSTTFQVTSTTTTSSSTTTSSTTSTTSTTTTTSTTSTTTSTTSSTTTTTAAGNPTTSTTAGANPTTSTTAGTNPTTSTTAGANPTTSTTAGANPTTTGTTGPATGATGGGSPTTSGGSGSGQSTEVGGMLVPAASDPQAAAAGNSSGGTPVLPFVPAPEGVAPFVPTDVAGGPSYLSAANDGAGETAGAEWWAGALLVAVAGVWWARRRVQ